MWPKTRPRGQNGAVSPACLLGTGEQEDIEWHFGGDERSAVCSHEAVWAADARPLG